MDSDARRLLYRLEMRIAQMCGSELVNRERRIADNDAWARGLIRAWRQVRWLREHGTLTNFEDKDER
jgi:hypothetical protein